MNLWSLLERAAVSHPRRTAVVDGELRLDYAQVRARAAALASAWSRGGVRPGERVAILEPNSAAYLEAYFAAAGLGAILAPLNTRLAPVELARILAHAGVRSLLAHGSHARTLESLRELGADVGLLAWTSAPEGGSSIAAPAYAELVRSAAPEFRPAEVAAGDVAHLYYTSGTTGAPKGVMLTHANVAWHALGARAELGLSDRDVWLHAAPMFHLADAWATFAITWCAGAHVFAPRFDEALVLEQIEREGVTLTNLVPTMLQRLVSFPGARERRFPALRLVMSGGASIAPSVVRAVIETFRCEYVQTYGMTETSPYLTLSLLKEHLRALPAEQRFAFQAKTGRAFATVELEVLGEDGLPVPRDGTAIGEIRARGPTVTPGYWNDPEATARAFDGGWLRTGDLATIDAEGYLQIVDRRQDRIVTGGEKVHTSEVESALHEHAAVLECAVFGVPDEVWGERVAAAVVLRPGCACTAEELAAHAREQLAGFKVPRRIEFLAELPKTGTGKIAKRLLREAAARAGLRSDASDPTPRA